MFMMLLMMMMMKYELTLKSGLVTKHTSNAARLQVVIWAYFQKYF
jgi:hypothetical protein